MNHPFGNSSQFRDGTLTIRYKIVPIKPLHKVFKFEILKSNDEGESYAAIRSPSWHGLRATSEREGRQHINDQLKADMAACTRLGFTCEINKDAGIITIKVPE